MNVCIIIPVHNEAKAIGQVVSSIRSKGLPVIVVDDGSVDNSGKIAEENGAVVVRHEKRNGKGYSLQRGFEKALQEGYDGVLAMDGDGQHAVEDIDAFLEQSSGNPDVVVTGNRMTDSKKMPFIRLATNKLMSGVISFICKQEIPDTQCGFRYLGSNVLRNIRLACNAFETETEMLIEASKKGYMIYSVPVQTIYRDEDSKINPLRDTVRFIAYIVKVMFKKTPHERR